MWEPEANIALFIVGVLLAFMVGMLAHVGVLP